MCFYILFVPLCGHSSTFLAGPSCPRVAEELSRIHAPESWNTTNARAALPFDWPDSCAPSDDNVHVVSTGKWCGWECRNTFGAEDGNDAILREMGVPDAEFGVKRKGVGWAESYFDE
ncbi:hypothetical protein F5Y18DRAFT_228433 [Xylariaceae sp. FL1019]|nr:hypothetical protein F5Y18DRAFT_228433 [Xylariaceae sp. FL1019]